MVDPYRIYTVVQMAPLRSHPAADSGPGSGVHLALPTIESMIRFYSMLVRLGRVEGPRGVRGVTAIVEVVDTTKFSGSWSLVPVPGNKIIGRSTKTVTSGHQVASRGGGLCHCRAVCGQRTVNTMQRPAAQLNSHNHTRESHEHVPADQVHHPGRLGARHHQTRKSSSAVRCRLSSCWRPPWPD